MLLSRFWYVVLAIAMAVAFYVATLAKGQFNRQHAEAMVDGIRDDQGKVEWLLKLDIRRRLDHLLFATNTGLPATLRAAQKEQSKEDRAKARSAAVAELAKAGVVRTAGAKDATRPGIPVDLAPDTLYAVDYEGRVLAAVEAKPRKNEKGEQEIAYEQLQVPDEMELGGYPVVFDALHGFSRDDTWIWPDARSPDTFHMYLVVARPIEAQLGEAPVGAIVGVKEYDQAFATYVAQKTKTSVGFYVDGKVVAKASAVGLNQGLIDEIAAEIAAASNDPSYKDDGKSDLHYLGATHSADDERAATYTRMSGAAWEKNAGFAVMRQKTTLKSPLDFFNGVTESDKRDVPLVLIILAVVGAIVIGVGLTVLEHTLPLRELAKQAAALKEGKQDQLVVPRFRGAYRLAAQNINQGVERIVEKGGGSTRKAADLESILGPVPAQPAMSAFSFPLQDGAQAVPSVPNPPATGPSSVRGPASTPQISRPTPSVSQASLPTSQPFAPPGPPQRPPPPLNPPPQAIPNRPPGPPPVRPPGPPPAPPAAKIAQTGGEDADDEEATMVAAIPAEVLAQATGENRKAETETAEWLAVYEDFIRTKKQCGEPTDGLTFEKFQHTLKKNRDALMARHGCKRVKFSVYVKEGRASLKATPVKD